MDDATAIDETASVFTSPRRRAGNFFWRKGSPGCVGVDIDVGVGVSGDLDGDFPRERNMGLNWG